MSQYYWSIQKYWFCVYIPICAFKIFYKDLIRNWVDLVLQDWQRFPAVAKERSHLHLHWLYYSIWNVCHGERDTGRQESVIQTVCSGWSRCGNENVSDVPCHTL